MRSLKANAILDIRENSFMEGRCDGNRGFLASKINTGIRLLKQRT